MRGTLYGLGTFMLMSVIVPRIAAADTSADQSTPSPETAIKQPATPSEEGIEKPGLDITDGRSRDRRSSAYTLAPHQLSLQTGFFGTGPDEIVGAFGINYGLGHGIEVGTNILHAGVGLLNLHTKWNFFERGPWALSVDFSPIWIHGNWLWFIGNNDVVANLDILLFPVALTASVQPTEILQFDLKTTYSGTQVFGSLDSDSFAFDADLVKRQLIFEPTIRLHVHKRLTGYLQARLPVWAAVPTAITTEVEVEPGVIVGGSTGGTVHPRLKDNYLITLGSRAMVSKTVFITFALNYGKLTERLYGSPLYPKIGAEFRF